MNYSSLYAIVEAYPVLNDPSTNYGYSPETMVEAVAIWIETHSIERVSEGCQVPVEVIRQWMAPKAVIDADGNEVQVSWWHGVQEQVREYIRDSLEAKLSKVTERALGDLEERLESGDTIFTRSGNQLRVPVKAKDLSTIAAQLLDRRHELVNERMDKEAARAQSKRSQDAVSKRLQKLERYLIAHTTGDVL